jgi:hypothetical protein
MAELYAQQRADRFADEAARLRDLGGADAPIGIKLRDGGRAPAAGLGMSHTQP